MFMFRCKIKESVMCLLVFSIEGVVELIREVFWLYNLRFL